MVMTMIFDGCTGSTIIAADSGGHGGSRGLCS